MMTSKARTIPSQHVDYTMDPAEFPMNDGETSTLGNSDHGPIANYFQLFDKALVQHTIDIQITSSRMRDPSKTLFLKDLLIIGEQYNDSLFEFFIWIFSEPQHESFLSKVCNIRLIHFHSKKELMKVFINPDSRCLVNHGHKLWVSRCLKGWRNVCMQEGNIKEQHMAEIMLSDLESGLTLEVDDVITPRNMGFSRPDNMYEYENFHPVNYEFENVHPRGFASHPMDFDENMMMRSSQDYPMQEPMHRRTPSFATERSDFMHPSNYQRVPPVQRSYSGMDFQKPNDNDVSKDIELLNLRRELAFRQSQLSLGSNPLKDMTNVREETNEQRKLEGALREMMDYYDKALQSKDSQLDALQKELNEKEEKFNDEIKTQQKSLEDARSFYVRDLENGKLFNEYQLKLQKELDAMKESYDKDVAEKAMKMNDREIYYEDIIHQMKLDFFSQQEQRDIELKEKEREKENTIKQLIMETMSGVPSSVDTNDDAISHSDSSLINFIHNIKSSIDNQISSKAQEIEIFEVKERRYKSLLIEKDRETQVLLVQKENEFRNILAGVETELKSSINQKESDYKQKISEKVNNLEALLSHRERDFKKIYSDKVTALENKIADRESYFKSLLSDKENIIGEKDKEIKKLNTQVSRADREQEREIATKIEEYTFEMNRLINENKDVQASYSCVIAIEKERVNLISKLEEELERKRNQVAPLTPKDVEDDNKRVIKLMEKKMSVKSMEYAELLQKQTAFQNQKSFFMSELEKMKKARDSEYTKLRRELSQKDDKLAEVIAEKSKGIDTTRVHKELDVQVQMDALNEQKRQLEKELRDVKIELSMKEFSKETSKKVNEVQICLEESIPKKNDVTYDHLHRDIDIIVRYEHEQALYIQELEQSVNNFQVEYSTVQIELETFKRKYFQLVDSVTKLRSLDTLQTVPVQKNADTLLSLVAEPLPIVSVSNTSQSISILNVDPSNVLSAPEEVVQEKNSNDICKDSNNVIQSQNSVYVEHIVENDDPLIPKKKLYGLINKFDPKSEPNGTVMMSPKSIRAPVKALSNSWIKNSSPTIQIPISSSPSHSPTKTNSNSMTNLDIETIQSFSVPVVEIVAVVNPVETIAATITPSLESSNHQKSPEPTQSVRNESHPVSPSEYRNTLSNQSLVTMTSSPSNSFPNNASTSFDSLCVSEVSEESFLHANKDIVETYKSKYLALQIEVPKPLSFAMERTISNENLKKNPLNSPPSAKLKFRNAEVLKAKTLFQDKLCETSSLIQTSNASPRSPQPKDDNNDSRRVIVGRNNDDKLPSKVSVLKIAMAKSSQELSKLFGINGTEVFDGEMMKKKFTSDFVFKDNFLWISAQTRSLHWVDDETEKLNPKISKYLLLDKNDVSKKLQGEMMGVVKSVVELSNGRIVVTTESGEKLELKMSSDNSASMWTKVIKMMT